MQTAALEALGLAREWSYGAIDIAPEDLDSRVRALAAEGYAGVNVTVPHKEAALALADSATDAAREIGAANTLSFQDGRIAAENTDAPGLLEAIGRDPAGSEALILGAGGSARACAWALTRAGAVVSIHNRTRERAERLASEFGLGAVEPGPSGTLDLGRFDLVVNTTSVGLSTANAGEVEPDALAASRATDLKALGVDADQLDEGLMVVDLVYGKHATALIEAARGKHAETVEGIEILVAQGAASLRVWTGADPPRDAMRSAAIADD
ncbi:shikimate dehydrogenase [Thermoleophilia bacterium SCSIO 60948]|nr:shikimate dehydrogenase [Thermoleophilia bacterium SCSIO 60948]